MLHMFEICFLPHNSSVAETPSHVHVGMTESVILIVTRSQIFLASDSKRRQLQTTAGQGLEFDR